MSIYIYPQDCADFSSGGLGQLFPTECTVTEEAAGRYELSLEHPITGDLRWTLIEPGCIVKAEVPVRENPAYEAPLPPTRIETSVVRSVFRVATRRDNLRMRTGPGTNHSIITSYPKGTEVVAVDPDPGSTTNNWRYVSVRNGGATGWMANWYLQATGEKITETFVEYKPSGKGVRPQVSREQLFRITEVERDAEAGLVRATALHIFYDNRGNLLKEAYEDKGVSAAEVVDHMAAKLLNDTPFTFNAWDITQNLGEFDYGFKSPVEILLDPDDGVAAQTGAQVIRDNYETWLIQDRERDMNVTVRRGKNLVGVTVTTDAADVVTRIVPVGKNKNGDDLFLDGTIYVDSPNIGSYAMPMAKRVDYDVKVVDRDADGESTFPNDAAARAKLRALAEADFLDHGVDLPGYGMEVDFVLLQYAEGFEDYADLQSVFLYDTVTVIDNLIGLYAKVRVTGYTWNVLTQQYDSVKLGKLADLHPTVYSYQMPTGGISGSKITGNTLSGEAIRSASIQYAKIATAAVERLSADAITALTAYIGNLTAETVTTDSLIASMANVLQLTAGNIDAETITTDALAAATAHLTEVIARYGYFEDEAVRHLVSETLHITDAAVAERVMIENLAVIYAQVVSATIGELCLRASDGNYYLLDVDTAQGTVTATPTQVSDAERAAGHTSGGKTILDTDITAENLNAANIFATYALVNQIDAARIDVDQLFAREAFIRRLDTAWITSDSALTIISRLNGAESAAEGAQAAISDMDHQLKLWFKFDSDRGLVVQKMDENGNPASIWYTVTDEVGYHIGRTDLRDYVFSAYRDRVWVQNLEIGDIVVKPSGKGGWAWSGR